MVVHRHKLRATLGRAVPRADQDRASRPAAGALSCRSCRRPRPKPGPGRLERRAPHDDAHERLRADHRAAAGAASRSGSIFRSTACGAFSTGSAIPSGEFRRSFMSPAPTARARPSPSCARCWRRPAAASTSTPRRISCASTSASGSARRAAAGWSATRRWPHALEECERANGARADHGVRDRDRRGVPVVLAPSRRRDAARGRPRRPARRHQRDRDAARLRDHAGLDGSSGVPRRHASRRSPPRRPRSSSATCRRRSRRRPMPCSP